MTDTEHRRTLVLTGASRGIGHATVQRFSNEGWRIITCSREDIPDHCLADPNWTHHIPTDLFDAADVERFVLKANEILGNEPVHALVNNAAVSPKTAFKERLGCLNGDLDKWREVFQLNFFTPLAICRGFAPALGRGGERRRWRDCEHHVHRRPCYSPLRGLRLFNLQSGAFGTHPGTRSSSRN